MYLLSSKRIQGHAQQIIIIAIGGTFGIHSLLCLVVLLSVRNSSSSKMDLDDFWESTESSAAKIGNDDGALAVVDRDILGDDELNEAGLIRKSIVRQTELFDEESL